MTAGNAFPLSPGEKSALDRPPNLRRPPEDLRTAWSEGRVDVWNGGYHVSAHFAGFERILDRRFWSAQARILMPMLERARADYEKSFRSLAPKHVVDQALAESELLELGPMAWAHRNQRVRLSGYSRLAELVPIRNKIAHSEAVDGELFRKAVAMLAGGEAATVKRQ